MTLRYQKRHIFHARILCGHTGDHYFVLAFFYTCKKIYRVGIFNTFRVKIPWILRIQRFLLFIAENINIECDQY